MQEYIEANKDNIKKDDITDNQKALNRPLRVVILDSGIWEVDERIVEQKTIIQTEQGVKLLEGSQDEIGHGTAVYDLISKEVAEVPIEYSIIKIIGANFACSTEVLFAALEYVDKQMECDILHISAGVTMCENIVGLEGLLAQLEKKGIIIISAFDNMGAISYPAASQHVIGVDITKGIGDKYQYEYVKDSVINVRAADVSYRARWKEGKKSILRGSSFAAPMITAKIIRMLNEKKQKLSLGEVLQKLETGASNIIEAKEYPKLPSVKEIAKGMKKAVVFPFNKEIHAIAANEDLLSFEVVGYYDVRLSQAIDKEIQEVHPHIPNRKIVKNYQEIDWDSFDTLILGHCEELNQLYKKDLAKELLTMCIQKGKNVYSFSNIITLIQEEKIENCKISFPYIDYSDIPKNRFGKLYRCAKPVVAVCGTSSKQGKFTLQLQLRRLLQQQGYQVGQLGTEPNGYLFGMDEVYPMGFHSSVYVKGEYAVQVVNEIMHRIEETDPEIILVGSQSGVVPYNYYNLEYIATQQYEFLTGTLPDAAILCVNANDPKGFIHRNIAMLESIGKCKVIAIVIFPEEIQVDAMGLRVQKNHLTQEQQQVVKEEIKKEFHRKTFLLGRKEDENELVNCIIDFF